MSMAISKKLIEKCGNITNIESEIISLNEKLR